MVTNGGVSLLEHAGGRAGGRRGIFSVYFVRSFGFGKNGVVGVDVDVGSAALAVA